jgi:uncharacterized protein HemY
MWLPIQLLFVAFLSSETDGELLKDYQGYIVVKISSYDFKHNLEILQNFAIVVLSIEYILITTNNLI